jgi:hypothetical protein
VGLDWVRLAELARGLAAEAGCELAGSRNFADGSVMFAMIERPRSTTPQRALVKLAPWNQWGAPPETIEPFAKEVATARNTRGILSGTVAARSLNVRDGGQLLGQFHILEGKLEPLVKTTARWHWRCTNAENALGCAQVQFEPHAIK